jgi:hypothetical protein
MSVYAVKKSEFTLEIAGPRGQGWRPAGSTHFEVLKPAIQSAQNGQVQQSLTKAEDLWIKNHGDMHNVRFRVRVTEETVHARNLEDASQKY